MTEGLPLPRMMLAEQSFESSEIEDLAGKVHSELTSLGLVDKIRPGDSVALAVGSRGIRSIDVIVRGAVDFVRQRGAKPFIVPAMGSHGGGTAAGQRAVLEHYGISEATMGCEIRAAMEADTIGMTDLETPVFLARAAAEADHIGVINRIKLHTKMTGPIQSGLTKMCLIGLGKCEGAKMYHRLIDRYSWQDVVAASYDVFQRQAPLRFGLGIVQNAKEEIAHLRGIAPACFPSEEARLLAQASSLMARLPFADIDLLIIDEMGKDISGTGMDTNITGRKPGSDLQVSRVFVRDLSAKTQGNAQGIGLADFTTRHLVDQIDFDALYLNSQTAHRTDTCKIPMTLSTDREALAVAVGMADLPDPRAYKVIWIKNTLELERICVSEAYLERLRDLKTVALCDELWEIQFDSTGRLATPFRDDEEHHS